MNKKNLKERSEVLAQVVLATAHLYHNSDLNAAQKGLLETLIGAGIWYLPSSKELFSGKISKAALEAYISDPKSTTFVEEHGFPRKVAGRALYINHLENLKNNPELLQELYIQKMGRFNLVLKIENNSLKKFQKADNFISEEEAYAKAGIELVSITDELYDNYSGLRKYQPKEKDLKRRQHNYQLSSFKRLNY